MLRDITERNQAEERAQLLQRAQLARMQAEEALRVRADVLATVTHDLKSPIGTVKGLAQLLQHQVSGAEPATGPALAEKLARIDGAATKMTRLINQLLCPAGMLASAREGGSRPA